MSGQADALATEVMTPQELEVVAMADAYHGAEAKQAAAEFMVAVGAGREEAQVVLYGLSQHLDTLDFVKKHEVARHLQELNKLLGTVAVTPLMRLVPDTKAEPEAGDGTAGGAVSMPEPEAELPPVIPHKYTAYQRRFMRNMFGEHNADALKGLSREQLEYLLNSVGEHYESLRIGRSGPANKAMRRSHMMAIILEGRKPEDIAGGVVSGSAVTAGLKSVIGGVRKRTGQDVLDAMVADAVKYRPPVHDEPVEPEETIDVHTG